MSTKFGEMYCYILFQGYNTIIRQNSSWTFLAEEHTINFVTFPYKYTVLIKIINAVFWVSQFIKICQLLDGYGSIFIETKNEILHLLLYPDGGVRDEFIPQRGNERLSHKYHQFQYSSTPPKD